MRVIAGKAKSLKLVAPTGLNVRPTTDRIKETLFNMIGHSVIDCSFLDLFSGSGSIGIEALSRGARECTFVEKDYKAMTCIKQNLNHTRLMDQANLIKKDVQQALKELYNINKRFDIIFLDPPYSKGWEEKVLTCLNEYEVLDKDGYILCESAHQTNFDFLEALSYEISREKHFKTTRFTFIKPII